MAAPQRKAALLVTAASLALLVALVVNDHSAANRRVELTFWDGAAADEPGYAEEASQQVDTGLYGYHVGYWEEPGYWNNRGLGDGAESQMDARMFADAADNNYFHTGGADFMDTGSLYNDGTDADSVSLDGTYNDAWPGTGEGLAGYENIQTENDAYDGMWEMDPLDIEASTDAAVSGSDIGGFKQVGNKQSQILAQMKCVRCYDGPDCVSGCRVPAAASARSSKKPARDAKAQKHVPLPHEQEAARARSRAAAHRQMSLAKQSAGSGVAARQPREEVADGIGGLEGILLDGFHKMSNPGFLCARYKCAVGGLWNKACGCSASDERRAEAVEQQKEAVEKREEEEREEEAAVEEEGRERWLGLHGIVLDASPLAERWMPEQHNEEPLLAQDWSTFWSRGQKLKTLGLNV